MKPGGVWVLEEATGLLRELPARSWVIWLCGTLPFTWALIQFLLEMTRSAFGADRMVGYSLALVLLYTGKHVAQGLFSRDCLLVLRGDTLNWPGGAALARLALVQAAWQPLRFPGLLAASIAVVPFPWVAAFLRNVGLSALERERGFVGEAWRLGRSDSRAHTMALLILTLCWLLLFINLMMLWFVVPMLLKAFFGWQTDMVRLAGRLLNSTTLLVTAILTFAALEPVAGALAAVRAFYAEAARGGQDLRGALRRMAAGLMVGVLLLGGAGVVRAQERPLDKAALDQKIDGVLHEPEFSWKIERAEQPGETQWLRGLFNTLAQWGQWIWDFYKKLFPDDQPGADGAGKRWSVNPELLRWAMIAASLLAAGCLVLIVAMARRRLRGKPKTAVAVAVAPAIDLADESVSAAQLVEDEWLRMADSYAGTGEFRLAMRALHLAGLRYLGEKGIVSLAPAKTGMEYGRELARRLRDVPAATDGFRSGLRQYEGVWYGFGEAGAEGYQALRATWEEMRRHA